MIHKDVTNGSKYEMVVPYNKRMSLCRPAERQREDRATQLAIWNPLHGDVKKRKMLSHLHRQLDADPGLECF